MRRTLAPRSERMRHRASDRRYRRSRPFAANSHRGCLSSFRFGWPEWRMFSLRPCGDSRMQWRLRRAACLLFRVGRTVSDDLARAARAAADYRHRSIGAQSAHRWRWVISSADSVAWLRAHRDSPRPSWKPYSHTSWPTFGGTTGSSNAFSCSSKRSSSITPPCGGSRGRFDRSRNCCDDLAVCTHRRPRHGRPDAACPGGTAEQTAACTRRDGGQSARRVRRVVAKGRQPEPPGREWLPAACCCCWPAWRDRAGPCRPARPTRRILRPQRLQRQLPLRQRNPPTGASPRGTPRITSAPLRKRWTFAALPAASLTARDSRSRRPVFGGLCLMIL